MFKQISIILLVLLLSSEAYSQISIGGQVSYLNLLGGSSLKNFGIGLKGDYAINDKTLVTGGASYFLGSTYSTTTYGNAYSSTTVPSRITLNVDYKVSFIQLFIGGKRYFVGDCEDDFGFYGLGELGLVLAPISTTISDYDSDLYDAGVTEGSSETLLNFTIGFGLGIEKEFGFGYVFADLKLNLPANKVNESTVEIQIPAFMTINAGVRIPFDL